MTEDFVISVKVDANSFPFDPPFDVVFDPDGQRVPLHVEWNEDRTGWVASWPEGTPTMGEHLNTEVEMFLAHALENGTFDE